MKNNKINILIILILTGCLSFAFWRINVSKEAKVQEQQTLYRRQNQAFGLSADNHDNRVYFHSEEELEIPRLIVGLHVYNSDQTDYVLTEDTVIDYLSEEYDSEGNLMVYSCPDEIADYIEWWFHGGDKKIDYYVSDINKYLREAGYDKNIYDMGENDVKDAIEEYESTKLGK